jgi:hypothetical protein
MRWPCSTASMCAAHRPRPPLSVAKLHAEDFSSLFYSLRAASLPYSPRMRAQQPSTEPYRSALRARAAAPRAPPPPSSPKPTTLSSKQRHRRGATGAASLPSRASVMPAHTGPPPATPTPPRAPPERRTPSRPNTRPPATAGHPLRANPLRPTTHCRRATATVSLPSPFASNRGHHRPRPLTGYFPVDQRRPAGRIWPVSRRSRGRGGGIPPCFLGWAETPRKNGPFS